MITQSSGVSPNYENVQLSEQNTISLTIQIEDSDESFPLKVSHDSTEWELKMMLQKSCKREGEDIRIEVIDDKYGDWAIAKDCNEKNRGRKLRKCGIQEGAILRIRTAASTIEEERVKISVLENAKPMRFPNFRLKPVEKGFNPEAPNWEKPGRGFNLVGNCQGCKKTVYISQDQLCKKTVQDDKVKKEFYLDKIIHSCRCPSPSCQQLLKRENVDNFIFLDCDYKIECTQGSNKPFEIPLAQAVNKAISFLKGPSLNSEEYMVEWDYLKVTVIESTDINSSMPTMDFKPIICVIVMLFAIVVIDKSYRDYQSS